MRFLAVVHADHARFRQVTAALIDNGDGGYAWCQADLLAFRFGMIEPGIRFALCETEHTGRCKFVKLLTGYPARALIMVEIPNEHVGFLMPLWDIWQKQFRRRGEHHVCKHHTQRCGSGCGGGGCDHRSGAGVTHAKGT